MRVLIAHAFYEPLGGGEHLSLRLAQALYEEGHEVTIATATPLDPERVRKIFGIDVARFRVVRVPAKVMGIDIARFGVIQDQLVKPSPLERIAARIVGGRMVRLRRLMVYTRIFRAFERMSGELGERFDLVIETQSNVVAPADISYIHFPALVDYLRDEHRGLHWRVYNWLVRKYVDIHFRGTKAGRVLTNSTWTAAMVYRVYRIVPDVVHPPVDVEFFAKAASSDRREKIVVTLSRFTAEKRLDRIVDVAAALRDYTFYLIGTTDPSSKAVIDLVQRRAEELGADNIVLLTNAPREKLLEVMSRASIYLHPPYPEHFGMAVVEAMAAGLVPIVYRDGGAWTDVVSRISPELGYWSVEEVPKIVRAIEPRLRELSARAAALAKEFSYERFKQRMLQIIDHVYRVKALARGRQ